MSNKRIIFTNNKQSKRGIMSAVLCVLCTASLLFSIITSYHNEGVVPATYGSALVVTLVMAFTGLGLGISAFMDVSKYRLLPTIGIVINTIDVLVLGVLLWVGLR